MYKNNIWCWLYMGAIIILVLICICATIYFVKREKKLVSHIQKMLDDAIAGVFEDKRLDESQISSIENSMWRYLCDNKVSYVNISDEKAQIQTMISDISHQTVTPIANIELYSQLLEEWYVNNNAELDADVMEEISSIREQAEKLDFLVQSLVKISRLETGIIAVNPQENDISFLLDAVEKQYRSKAEQKGIRFSVDFSEYDAYYDLKWSLEAIGNIVDNAIKYTDNGGKIQIRARQYSMFVRIDIIDNGIGVAESEQGGIFTRFYRSASVNDKPGVGIGLYLAREVLKAQDGYIKVESKVGEGSIFSVFLLRGKKHKSETIEKRV